MSDNHFLGALLEPSLPSRVEREDTLNTPLWEGLADTQVSLIMLNGGDMANMAIYPALGFSNHNTPSPQRWKGLHLHHKQNPRAHNTTHKGCPTKQIGTTTISMTVWYGQISKEMKCQFKRHANDNFYFLNRANN